MAAVSPAPSPQGFSTMANRRVPLANVPNATNSPFRSVAAATGKRSRSYASDQRELAYGQAPPAKKYIIEIKDDENSEPRPFARPNNTQDSERVFMKKTSNAPPTAFERKLAAVRDGNQAPPTLAEKEHRTINPNSSETIRQWQRYYRKVFPQFVFYFESIPEEVRVKASRQIAMLGAKEEKFFSKAVTHVVTTRTIPPEIHTTSPADGQTISSNANASRGDNAGPKTINPSLLDRIADSRSQAAEKKPSSLLDTTLQKRAHSVNQPHDFEARRVQAGNSDILYKAREMGMKIWALEKLQRMMTTMFTDTGDQPHGHNTRSNSTATLVPSREREADLQQLLKNEKLNGPADRDMAVLTSDMVQFRGYYVYVHDMDEQTRPVMGRDYPKPANKENGKWPQLRLTPAGRCPFVEDQAHTRKLQNQLREQDAKKAKEGSPAAAAPRTRTRAAAAVAATKTENPVLGEIQSNARRGLRDVAYERDTKPPKPLDPPKVIPAKRGNPSDSNSVPSLFGSAQANLRTMPRMIGGEPVASGLQQSSITSAIRSQIVSSTAISSTAPGARVGTSKDIQQLKRKVSEKNSVPSNNSIPSSYMNDMRAAINGDRAPPPRAAKRKAQETLGFIHEEEDGQRPLKRSVIIRKKKVGEKELKPGYCENCRDKFEDFSEHILSRKHRKFALTPDNWKELDELLVQLDRPRKD
ncbi:Dfp1/Him1, central region-domain-containing protein [Cryomyces antarcticus]